jgi:hypothetical protein
MTGQTESKKPRKPSHFQAISLVVRSFAGLLEKRTGSGMDDWTVEETEAVALALEVLAEPAAAARLRELRRSVRRIWRVCLSGVSWNSR